MANVYANEARKGALDGIVALLSGGNVLFTTTADAELAVLPAAGGEVQPDAGDVALRLGRQGAA